MPAPPSKKVLAELDSSMVEHGELETGIPCVPITIEKRVKGNFRTTEAHSHEFTLVDIRQRLLNRTKSSCDCTVRKTLQPSVLFGCGTIIPAWPHIVLLLSWLVLFIIQCFFV